MPEYDDFPIILTDMQSNPIKELGTVTLMEDDTLSTVTKKIKNLLMTNELFSISFLPNPGNPGTILGLSRIGYMIRPLYYTSNDQYYSQVSSNIAPIYQTDKNLTNTQLSKIMVHNPQTLSYDTLWRQMNGIGLKFD